MKCVMITLNGFLAAALMFGQQGASDTLIAEGLRLYTLNCAGCHGGEGHGVEGVDLRSGQFRRAATDADLARIITGGIPGTAMPSGNFAAGQVASLIAYLRSPTKAPVNSSGTGDVTRGRAVFEQKGACVNCHRVKGAGSRLGPDLSEIGNARSAAELEASILNPNAMVLPQHRFVQATTKQGATISGRRVSEDTLSIRLIDSNEQLRSFSKDDLREHAVLKTSPMPSYKGKLTAQELADVVTYLTSLK